MYLWLTACFGCWNGFDVDEEGGLGEREIADEREFKEGMQARD